MHFCYVDESGNDQVLDRPDAAPVLVIAGLVVAEANLKNLIWGYLDLKKKFERNLASAAKLSDVIRHEIKGSDLRADLRSGSRRRERRAIGILDGVMELLEQHNVSLSGQIWVKRDGEGVSAGYYPDAIARIARDFQSLLASGNSHGLMILDARTHHKNVPSVNGITTRKFRTGGDELARLVESPVFGHSDAHVVLQIADIVASALLFPLACLAYCSDLENNVHPHAAYEKVRDRFGARVRALEWWFPGADGVRRGGVCVRDHRGEGKSHHLYQASSSAAPSPTIIPIERVRNRRRGGISVPRAANKRDD